MSDSGHYGDLKTTYWLQLISYKLSHIPSELAKRLLTDFLRAELTPSPHHPAVIDGGVTPGQGVPDLPRAKHVVLPSPFWLLRHLVYCQPFLPNFNSP